jgi:hypothetical protein
VFRRVKSHVISNIRQVTIWGQVLPSSFRMNFCSLIVLSHSQLVRAASRLRFSMDLQVSSVLQWQTRPQVHCTVPSTILYHGIDLRIINSKNSPDASIYDKTGKPFARLLEATGCSAGKNAVSCLQKVPFEVRSAFWKCLRYILMIIFGFRL